MNDSPGHYYTLITGASSGIGNAFARECAHRHQNLLLVSLPETGLEKLAQELTEKHGIDCRFFEIDLRKESAYCDIFAFAKSNNLKINILINNVGVGYNGPFAAMDRCKILNMLQLNIYATTLLTQTFLTELKHDAKSYILNVGSLASFAPTPGKSIYSATKAYILFFTKSLKAELRHTNVSVSAIFPAGVPTNNQVIYRMSKQSKLAKSLNHSAEQVAFAGIEGMLKGKEIIFPGKRLKTLIFSARIIPYGILLKQLEREFRRSPDE